MSTPVTYVANQYNVPAYQDTGYAQGAGNLSSYLIALATGSLTLSGGSFPLTADANFGGSFGLVSIYFKSRSSNIATTGILRLANTDVIGWMDNASANNITVKMNATQTGGAVYTIPDTLATTANFVMSEGAATINGVKTFGGIPVFSTGWTSTGQQNQVTYSTAGNTANLLLQHSNAANAASHSTLTIETGGASGGDPWIRFYNNVISYSYGMDNSDSDALCWTAASTLNGTNLMRLTSAGALTIAAGLTVTTGGVSLTAGALTVAATTNQIVLGVTNTTTISSTAPASSRTYTIIDAGGAADFVMTAATQTIGGAKTFSSAVAISATSNHIVLSTASNTLTINANSQATSARTWSVPDITGNGTFAALEGTQTFSGAKTFSAVALFPAGSNSAPGVAVGDAANGMYRSAANEVSITTNSTQALIVSSGQDVYTVAYTDYSASSTIVGFSAFTTKIVGYKKLGKTVYVWIQIDGTSNATNATVTLPYQNNGGYVDMAAITYDSGVAGSGRVQLPPASSTVSFFKTVAAGAFTNSGNKIILASFTYTT